MVHDVKIVMRTGGLQVDFPGAAAAESHDPRAGGAPMSEPAVYVEQFGGRTATVQTAEEQRGGGFDHRQRGAAQNIGQADVRGIVSQADRVGQAGVWVKLNEKLRRPSLASEAGENSLKDPFTAGNASSMAARLVHFFRRTTAGSIVFWASATSETASFVLSIASCKVSL